MSRHVDPRRWADAEAGTLSSRELARIEAHARDCERCSLARARVLEARAAMREIAADEPTDMRWDQIGAQVYWRISSERRASPSAPRWRTVALVAGLAAGATAAAAAYLALGGGDARVALPAPAAPARIAVDAPPVPAAPVQGVVVVAQGDVRVDGAPLEIDRLIEAGQTLRTGSGRVVVQFDRDSTFALGPDTTLELSAFDASRVRLDVRGVVDVRLSRRAPEQRFSVGAGQREVVVRGTVFRVAHDEDALEVACARGRVSVVEGDDSTDVRAGEHITVADVLARSGIAQPIPEAELAELTAALQVPVLPAWDGARAALDATVRLDVEASPAMAVEVDGIRVGQGALVLRLSPGRHHIERTGAMPTWVELETGARAHATFTKVRRPPRQSVRTPQLEAALRKHERALQRCARSLAVHGIAEGSFVTLELGINRDGSQGYLNIVDSNVPAAVARCVRDIVDGVTLPRGPRETLRKTIPFDEQ